MSCSFAVKGVAWRSIRKTFSILMAAGMVMLGAGAAHANSKYSAIVVDGNTGRVLHADHADASRFPASLTKIMTLYILFEYLEKGRLGYDTKFFVTRHASAQPPSKLGLKPGSYIKVRDIIGALVTKSANDVAVVTAENIAGSEAKFAALMTRRARQLGMSRTTFMNASGLPNRRQRTTARDMARLSMRIMNDFPQYARAFKTRYFRYHRRSFRNHNRLLFSYRGMEGIKTGYTRASGFNLTTSVKRGRKHLIAVVMGGRSARRRNAAMRNLLNRYFPRAVAMAKKPPLAQRMAMLDGGNARVRYTAATTSWQGKNRPEAMPSLLSKSVASAQYDQRSGGFGGYDIQIGAYEDRNMAVSKLTDARSRAAALLNGHQPYIMQFNKNGVNYHRARFAGFDSRMSASSACNRLKRKYSVNCIVMLP
jgi:D-alanyl-D-alanine carboxypeptidase